MQLYDSFLHLCKMSALWNSIPKRSIHHGEESLGISLEAWTVGSLWRSTWIHMQNNVVNQSCCFFLPPSKKFVFPPEEVYNGEPTFSELYRERLLVSLKLGCRHCQSFAISTKKKDWFGELLDSPFRGMEELFLISSICLQKGNPANSYLILNFQGWFV